MLDSKTFKIYKDILKLGIDNHSTMPILNHVLIEGNMLTATDLETTITIVDAGIQPAAELKTCIPFEILDKSAKIAKDNVKFDILENRLEIDDKKSLRYTNLDSLDFPDLSLKDKVVVATNHISSDYITELEYVLLAISKDDMRRNLAGMLFTNVDNVIKIVGTDGHRLHYKDIKTIYDIEPFKDSLIPQKTIQTVIKVCKKLKNKQPIELICYDNFVLFVIENVTITARLIDSTFPDYNQVTPESKNQDNYMTVNTLEFKEALTEHKVIKLSETGAVKFTLNGNLTLESANGETNFTNSLNCNYRNTDNIGLGFHYQYLIDSLQDTETTNITFSDELSPIIIEGSAVVMPMRI